MPMASPPRILPKKHAVFVTSRTEEGLPFVATEYMKLIIMSVLARAQHLYPVLVCAYCWMGNHLHMVLVVEDPELIAAFMDRIKTELGHAVNRLLGRRNRTVWSDDYDSPPILTIEDVLEKIVYTLTNPQAANLIDTIDEYPGVHSWNMFTQEDLSISVPWIQRPMIEKLSRPAVTSSEDAALTEHLTRQAECSHTFTLTPFAWLECFNVPTSQRERMRARIIALVREREATLRKKRTSPCLGASKLRRQSIAQSYTPTKFSKRMWCICRDKERRRLFINRIKLLVYKARTVYKNWKRGDFSVPYPLELFAPRMPHVSLCPNPTG
jgi:hypothetical protein